MRAFEPAREQLQAWEDWLRCRPEGVAEVARRFPPWEIFDLNGKLVTVQSFQEGARDGAVTMTVFVGEALNGPLLVQRSVFGVCPGDLPAATEANSLPSAPPPPPGDQRKPGRRAPVERAPMVMAASPSTHSGPLRF